MKFQNNNRATMTNTNYTDLIYEMEKLDLLPSKMNKMTKEVWAIYKVFAKRLNTE